MSIDVDAPKTPCNTTTSKVTDEQLCLFAKKAIKIESDTIAALHQRIDETFVQACRLLLACRSRIVVIGMGKSGHIGHKLAATLASTGSPAFFVHPGEAGHGDLGMITAQDVVIALSHSGKTEEVLTLVPFIKRLNVSLITITGDPDSDLARAANVNLDVSIQQEACPLGLAPTSSTTAALVMGDALAVTLLQARDFSAEDFALAHPRGSLGRRLLLKVKDIMHRDGLIPRVSADVTVAKALLEMTQKSLGMTGVVDQEGKVIGIFTDGDLRRMLSLNLDIHTTPIADVMTPHCKVVSFDLLAAEALHIMETNKINALLVVDADNQLAGALNMHDLLRAKIL